MSYVVRRTGYHQFLDYVLRCIWLELYFLGPVDVSVAYDARALQMTNGTTEVSRLCLYWVTCSALDGRTITYNLQIGAKIERTQTSE